jgi:hypothetical protein
LLAAVTASAAAARKTPCPIFSRVSASFIVGFDFDAEENSANLAASIRIDGREYRYSASQCSASQSAAAAAICGVAADVPTPSMSTTLPQTICAHGSR